jgi:hypothetical protein
MIFQENAISFKYYYPEQFSATLNLTKGGMSMKNQGLGSQAWQHSSEKGHDNVADHRESAKPGFQKTHGGAQGTMSPNTCTSSAPKEQAPTSADILV